MTESSPQDGAGLPPLVAAFRRSGQGQVFAFWDRLNPGERDRLMEQAAEIDLSEVDRLVRTLVAGGAAPAVDLAGITPAAYEPLPEHGGDPAAWARAAVAGEAALRAGRIAAFTVAGGQGTRLGFDGPKGTFPVTPLRGKSLFAVFAEKLDAAGRRYGRPLHWFIMTSHQNHAATEAFLAEHRHFGLDPGRVHCFRQGRMPAVDFSGRILLEAPDSIALSPDGHGGSLRALERSGALDLMAAEGVDTLSYFQVDNPLVRCVDPAFLGWHLMTGSEMSSKAVPKAHAEEKLGHFCRRGDELVVIEYSDLPAALQRETDPASGELRYRAGSIAIHALDREFIRRVARGSGGLPFHRADKKIPFVDAAGRSVHPDRPNGVKFELFVFDALPFAARPLVVETLRADDFSPVKNAEGADSPATCRADQLRQFGRWLRAAGAPLATDPSGLPEIALEVAPRFGYDEATFRERWSALAAQPALVDGLYLDALTP
jgi:UDP-N-acetylglucosamine/UDP-N-acetylgalactosamine diphosphorylase